MVSSSELNRSYDPVRRGLVFGGLATAGAVALGGAGWLLHKPDAIQPPVGEQSALHPGWIEAKISSPFVEQPSFWDKNKGHFPWTREAVFSTPSLFSLTQDYFTFLDDCRKSHRQLGLGESLSYVVEKAREKVREIPNVDSETNYDLEAVHAATIAFASGFFTWFPPKDMEQFGISLDGYPNVTDYYWYPDGVGTNVFPRLFVKENSQLPPQFNGADRTVHFATHLLLVFEYLYSRHYNLITHQQIPFYLKLALSPAKNPQEKALALSKILGLGHEFGASLNPKNWPIDPTNLPREGVFDPLVGADYKGNQLGAHAAIKLWEKLVAGETIDPVLAELNDPKFTRYQTLPIL